MKKILLGLAVIGLWFIVGGFIFASTYEYFIMASMGGVFTPPAIWTFARDASMTVLPIMLAFGGVPTAIQTIRGRPWEKIFLVSLSVCLGTWFILVVVVLWGPSLFGWSW